MMTDWYERSINALQLNGKGEGTQEAYTRAVRMLLPSIRSEALPISRGHPMRAPGFLSIGLKRPRRSSQSL